jgi:hypothetical protein
MLRINSEADMWKITTRGFTLEEVLIMAAMNLLASGDSSAASLLRMPSNPSRNLLPPVTCHSVRWWK